MAAICCSIHRPPRHWVPPAKARMRSPARTWTASHSRKAQTRCPRSFPSPGAPGVKPAAPPRLRCRASSRLAAWACSPAPKAWGTWSRPSCAGRRTGWPCGSCPSGSMPSGAPCWLPPPAPQHPRRRPRTPGPAPRPWPPNTSTTPTPPPPPLPPAPGASAPAAPASHARPSAQTLAPEDLHDAQAVAAWLTERIAAQLRLDDPARLSPRRDLLQLGLDSLLFLELSSDIQRQLGVRLDAERAYRDLTVAGLSQLIVDLAGEAAPGTPARQAPAPLQHDAAGRHHAFPLTPIQHAYWLGRTDLIEYGGVACHVLFEWDLRHGAFDLPRFERAWNPLVRRHDMLRMVVDADGQQRIPPQVPAYRIARRDLRALSAGQQQQALEDTRQTMSYSVPPADRSPLFQLVASELDVQSFKVMMDDLALAYRGEDLEPLAITFRDYVLAEQARRQEDTWQGSWHYWQERLREPAPAPRPPAGGRHPPTPPR